MAACKEYHRQSLSTGQRWPALFTSVCFIHICPERDEPDSSLHLASEYILVRFHFLLPFDFICRTVAAAAKKKTQRHRAREEVCCV